MNGWHVIDRKPDFFVVDDDMYGMSVRVEAECILAKPALLEEFTMLLKQFEEWCVYLALVKGGLFILHDRILIEGTFFPGCCSVEDLYHRCAPSLSTRGASSDLFDYRDVPRPAISLVRFRRLGLELSREAGNAPQEEVTVRDDRYKLGAK